MKKLSIEQKAQRYDEAIERAKALYKAAEPMSGCNVILETVFPELLESEDEKIRKKVIATIHLYYGEPLEDEAKEMVAWLEKQGEQKPVDPDTLIQQRVDALADIVAEQKPADKVEPKFHEGEWITNGDYTWKIVEVKPLDYILQSQDGNIVDDTISHVDEQFHSFNIQDAKDGDVLATNLERNYISPFIAIYKERGLDYFNSYCFIGSDGKFYTGDTGHDIIGIHPATKEQRDTLEKAMADARWEFDFKKKELKKIVDKEQIKNNLQDNSFRKMFEQKST